MAKTRLISSGMAQLLKSSEVRATLAAPAAAALSRMQSGCPVRTGELKSSLEVWDDETDRAVKRVGSRTVDYALVAEADHGFMARSV